MRTVAVLVVLLGVLTPAVSGQTVPKSKKFLGGPLVIEDQGSFFVGGVQKITEHAAAVPPAAPGTAAPTGPVPQQITIGQMYVQFQIPAKQYGAGWPVIMVQAPPTPAPASRPRPTAERGGTPISFEKASRATWSIRPGAGAPGSTSRSFTTARRVS